MISVELNEWVYGRLGKSREVDSVRTARWQLLDSELWIWLNDPHIFDTEDHYPVLRRWMEKFINGYPFIVEDTLDDPWVESNAGSYPGPIAGQRPAANLLGQARQVALSLGFVWEPFLGSAAER